MNSKGKVKKGMWMDAELVKKIEIIAKMQNRTFGNTVETILKRRIQNL